MTAWRRAHAVRAAALGIAACCAVLAMLSACGTAQQAVLPLDEGRYSGVDPAGNPVDVRVGGSDVKLDSRDTWLPDPTTTGTFLVRQGTGYEEWYCVAAEKHRSLHCDVWMAPLGAIGSATPTAEPCISPSAGNPAWCNRAATHARVDLLKICTDPGCS